MKKELFILLLLLISISQVLAIETTLKSNYQPGETLIAEFSGNFLENIKPENILFYSGRTFIPLIYDIAKIQDKYYLYALLPVKERNYTLIIKNVRYFELGLEKQEDLQFNFTTLGNISLFNSNPGFILTNDDFKIKVTSNIKTISVRASFLNSTQEISLLGGQTKAISFSIAGIRNFTFTNLLLTSEDTSYDIPTAIFPVNVSDILINKTILRFSKSFLNLTVLKDHSFNFEISISNTGQEDITNIELSTDLPIILHPDKIEKLESGSQEKINLTVNSDEAGLKTGKILASSENYTEEISIYILTTENKTALGEIADNIEVTENSCSNLNGEICNLTQECDGTTQFTLEGLCCIGDCETQTSGGAGKIISIVIIIIFIAVIGFFVYKKLKARRKTSEEVLKEKSSSYEERFKSKEVRGGLTKV